MKKLETREQAEARAMELFPTSMNLDRIMEISACRKAFLQCWEEMQKNKQTCGFCVEPKNEEEE